MSKDSPPPYGFNQPAGQNTMYNNAPVLPATVPLGDTSTRCKCPSCQSDISTKVVYKSSTKTHLFALLLCLIFFPCVCVPYCVDSCQTANHYCPSCNAYLGQYNS